MTHNGANTLGSLNPKRSANSIRSALSCALTLLVSPDNIQTKSPGLAPVTSAHLAKSS